MASLPLVLSGLVAATSILMMSPPASAEDWPGNWTTKLTQDEDQWRPVKEVLIDLARRAGSPTVVCPDDPKCICMVPRAAGLTLREAFQYAATCSAYQIQLQDNKLVITPGKSAGDAGWVAAIGGKIEPIQVGEAQGSLFLPAKKSRTPIPWVWYAPAQGLGQCNSWITKKLLDQGIALAMVNVGESWGNPKGVETFQAFYEILVKDHAMAKKPVLWPQSRGGMMLYNWATAHPDCVQAVGGTYTVCNLEAFFPLRPEMLAQAFGMKPEELQAQLSRHNPVDHIDSLVKNRVPILHIHGDKDTVVPLDTQAAELVKRYKALGGHADLLIIPGKGHEEVAEYFQCKPLADFMVKQAKASVTQ